MPFCNDSSNSPSNVTNSTHSVTRYDRAIASGDGSRFMGCTIWFTGLSGSGKSTLAFALERRLLSMGVQAYTLDGDNIRLGLNKDLRFSNEDRAENIRRVAEVTKLFAESGTCAIASFISPFEKQRKFAREQHEQAKLPFFEVYLSTPLEVCEARDVKFLYAKARRGEIPDFTGVNSPYEVPLNADLCLNTAEVCPEECTNRLIQALVDKQGILSRHMTEGNIQELFVPESERSEYVALANKLPQVAISKVDLQWVQVLAEGWASPLRGFMREAQFLQVLYFGGLVEGRQEFFNLSIPIVLAITNECKEMLGSSVKHIALTYNSVLVAVLLDIEIYEHRKVERCNRIFGICDSGHPTIKQIMSSGDNLVGGDLHVLDRIVWNDGLDQYRLTPRQLRAHFKKVHADAVFGFQLRNPVHNGHALLMRETRRVIEQRGFRNPLLLLHPLGGWTKPDDIPLEVRMKQHQACLQDGVLDADRTLLAIFPSPMIYAGPREVQWHARSRLAAGVHFYIVGRDPAGLPHPAKPEVDLYDPTHGAKVLSMAPGLKGLEIVPFRVAAYNKVRGAMEMYDPSRAEEFIFISGTKMRALAREGQPPPDGFMSPSAWKVLADYYAQQSQHHQQQE